MEPHNADELEYGRWLFAQECGFVAGVAKLHQLPDATLPEVAFAGRSNVGKSSLVNALTGRRTLARTSHTPGRTQQMNFFDLGGRLMLCDLPGYGYAKVSKTLVAEWTEMVDAYLRGRQHLRRALVLIDGRHGIKDSDRRVMDMLDQAAVTYQVVLTKADKAAKGELQKVLDKTTADLAKRAAAFPQVLVTSAHKGIGIPEARAALAALSER